MRTSHSSGSTFFDLRQTITTVKTIRHLPPLSNRFEQSPKITNTTCSFYILQPGSSHPPPGWVLGPGRLRNKSAMMGGEAPALCDGSDDVGLDNQPSRLLFQTAALRLGQAACKTKKIYERFASLPSRTRISRIPTDLCDPVANHPPFNPCQSVFKKTNPPCSSTPSSSSHQPRKHLPRAALHKLRHAVGEHVLHALRPTDGGEE